LLTLIAARGRNGVIGAGDHLPWRLATDLKHFKARTLGKPVLMGRRTWQSIGKALPGRANLVLTRDARFAPIGAWAFSDIDALCAAGRAIAQARGATEICVIGGGEVFAALLAIADSLVLTEVDASPPGAAYFPAFAEADFVELSRSAHPAGPDDDHAFIVRELRRR
jgi:dihydrofolate reductase